MAKKLFALIVMCVVAVAALRGCDAAPESIPDLYKECYTNCQNGCMSKGKGYTFCEVKCDEDCTAIEAAEKLARLD